MGIVKTNQIITAKGFKVLEEHHFVNTRSYFEEKKWKNQNTFEREIPSL